MGTKISELNTHTPDGTEYLECIITPYTPGTNRRITSQQIADLGGGGSKVDEETFATLTYGATVTWNTNSRQNPLAKVTATGSFTIDMTNVKDGSFGRLLVISGVASTFVLTFDTTYTNKSIVTGDALLTWTFPNDNGAEYTCEYYVDGTTIRWIIGDYSSPEVTNPFAKVRRAANQVLPTADVTNALSFDTEDIDNLSIFDAGSPTLLTVPGTGNKIATVYVYVEFATNATGIRRVWIYVNGAAVTGNLFQDETASAAVATTVGGTIQFPVVAGDTIEIRPYQNSGGNLNITGVLTVKFESR